eukprot:6198980-Pleurochrysis_carterae.AAC.1
MQQTEAYAPICSSALIAMFFGNCTSNQTVRHSVELLRLWCAEHARWSLKMHEQKLGIRTAC